MRTDLRDWISEVKLLCIERDYTYNRELENKGYKVYVSVTCNKHNIEVAIRADRFVLGAGCIQCRGDNIAANKKTITTEQAIISMIEKHGDTYDYSEYTYSTKKVPSTIICPVHGRFKQTSAHHIKSAYGCPSCAKFGFKPKQTAYLYLLTSKYKCKVGITNNTVSERLRQINTSGGTNFTIDEEYLFDTGEEAKYLETLILRCSGISFGDSTKYSGSTEVTDISSLGTIKSIIKEYLDGS